MSNNINLGQYLGRLNSTFDKSKSLTDILNSFRCMSKEYTDFNNSRKDEFTYSSYNLEECTDTEKELFIETKLDAINCLITDKIQAKVGRVKSWLDIYNLLHNKEYALTEKSNRKVVFSTSTTNRPIGDVAYNNWNGIQIIDLDIKDGIIAEKAKSFLFDALKRYEWFIGCCKSASGKGLHVWTKISPITMDFEKRKIEFVANYRHKYSYVYMVLIQHINDLGITKDDVFNYLDMAMGKPQQGIFISSDNNALFNTHFNDLRLDVNFESAFENGVESIDWINHPDLKQIFAKLEWFSNDTFDDKTNVNISDIEDNIERDDSKNVRKHYKHHQRWQLANTLSNIYVDNKELALKIMIEICSGTDKRELMGDIKTAYIHHKPISMWAIRELNKFHGFNIKIKNSEIYTQDLENLVEKSKSSSENYWESDTNAYHIQLHRGEYLSDRKDEIITHLGKMTLLEAGAGYGKTEMIKSLKAKTMLILPFTSTIKSKVEGDSKTSDWLYFYGSKRPSFDDLMSGKNISMTIDKFSKLNLIELNTAGFEYIVVDESHLMFTSSFRSVMSPTIQRLANCSAKVIMMTGTPTGELLFFPNIQYIKVIREFDSREKNFTVYMSEDKLTSFLNLCNQISEDISNGYKILFPSNKGNLYFETICSIVQNKLNANSNHGELHSFYYKKSNYGDNSMDDINFAKTVGQNDIVMCTTYLSVGVDIWDNDQKFCVYYDEPWIAQDIEQFTNRLRNQNLNIKMFLPRKDNQDMPIDYSYSHELDLSFDNSEILALRDYLKTANDMIMRNQEESRYNPLITSLLAKNPSIQYDENECKYFIDETTYKLHLFEERYSEYAKQFKIMQDKMRDGFGYDIDIKQIPDGNIPSKEKQNIAEYIKQIKTQHYNKETEEILTYLDHITDDNIETYKEIMRGNMDIYRSEKYEDRRTNEGIYVNNIEVVEKNNPIVLSLYKYYDIPTIKEIYNFCKNDKSNKINFGKLKKIRKLANIEYNIKKKHMDFPILRYILDTKEWVNKHPVSNKDEITKYQVMYAVKYADSVPNVTVKDKHFLEQIYEIIRELWSVLVDQSRPNKKKEISLKVSTLDWEKKQTASYIYGNDYTKIFLGDNILINKEICETDTETEEEEVPQLTLTEKDELTDVLKELSNVMHISYEYMVYSEQSGANERLINKETNGHTEHHNTVNVVDVKEPPKVIQLDLFNNATAQ